MDSDRWKQLDSLLQSALERRPAERDQFLRDACAGDVALEQEVRSLLSLEQEAGAFLEFPAAQLVSETIGEPDHGGSAAPDSFAGRTISHYRIVEKLGSGGMGVVYKAEDLELRRFVAMKFLPEELIQDELALERFRREARAASSLNHPNICTIHEIGRAGELSFIVMEFLDGATLRHYIGERPLTTQALLPLSIEIADALAAAHSARVIHRDIKSSNIFVTKSGHAKILDFGMAKAPSTADEPVRSITTPQTATIKESLTAAGNVWGTIYYMSPEQARQKDLDARTDVFSFGVVLYEMATGRLPFTGKNAMTILEAILNHTPAPAVQFNPDLPHELERIIAKCLEKDRDLRYQHASEIVVDLQRLKHETDSSRQASVGISTRRRWKLMALATVILASIVASYSYLHRKPKLTDRDTIVLADFVNRTGDPVFDGTLRQGLAVELQQSPFLSLISDQRIRKTLELMAQPADAPLTPGLARDVCVRNGSAAVLNGDIALLGKKYALSLTATNCQTGEILDEEQVQAPGKEDVLDALTQIAGKFRTRVGESFSTIEKHSTPLAEATTSSIEALKAFSTADKVYSAQASSSALVLFKRAINLDPNFAMAYARLGQQYGEMGESDLSAENIRKAYQLRDHASDREKFFLELSYNFRVTGNLENAQQICNSWAQAYPRAMDPHAFLSTIYQITGRYEKSVEEGKRAIELDPEFAIAYANLASAYQDLNHLSDAESTLQAASQRQLHFRDFSVIRYDIAFLKGDQAGMQRAVALAEKESQTEDLISDKQAFAIAYTGRLQEATRMAKRATELADHAGQREEAALYEAGTALREAFFGNAQLARSGAFRALAHSKDREVEYAAAFALALSGNSRESEPLANDLERRFGEDTSVRFAYLPEIRALLALNHHQPSEAIEFLQIAVPYELGTPRSTIHGFFGALYPLYVRGSAYLAAGQGSEAAAEFERILSYRGIVVSDPISTLARLQLGRAFALSGNKTKAKAAYQNFLALWKDADSDIPIFKQAKSEYSKLQ